MAYPLLESTVYHQNFTCGRNAWEAASNTSTAAVLAGSDLGFHSSYHMFHPGPAQVYLAKVEDTLGSLETTVGDELEWFKIAYIGPANQTFWTTYLQYQVRSSGDRGEALVQTL